MRAILPIVTLLLLMPFKGMAQTSSLTVEKIMQDPKTWIGAWPSRPYWSEDGKTLYFRWNPGGKFAADSLYSVSKNGGQPQKVSASDRLLTTPNFDGWHSTEHVYSKDRRKKVFQRSGDLFVYDLKAGRATQYTATRDRESNPHFSTDDQSVFYIRGQNVFRLSLDSGAIRQLTDLRSGTGPQEHQTSDPQKKFLESQQKQLFQIIRKRQEQREARDAASKRDANRGNEPAVYYYGSRQVRQLKVDPTGTYVSFVLTKSANNERTIVANYVTSSGYAEDLASRAKVGGAGDVSDLYIMDLRRDTTFQIDLTTVPGSYDVVPSFLKEAGVEVDSNKVRNLFSYGPFWNEDGSEAVLEIRTFDNKDRWLVRLNPQNGALTVLDRQSDEAWLAGPGISWFGGGSTMGWQPDNRHFYFQSEKTGFSHLWNVDVRTGEKKQLTSGDFEVFGPDISKDGKKWYFTSSEDSPFERHWYEMPIEGGERVRLTTKPGNNAVSLNPDGRTMAVLHSYTNAPPEIFVQEPRREPQQVTYSTTADWRSYHWRTPQVTWFEASDGVRVPSMIFEPAQSNGAAVIFVHGAGYLQNVHYWWSSYFREYMFNNMLADLGYTVINVDYRASSGYGRDWRTAIYRYMGGRDLQDEVDASEYLTETYNIDPEKVFIYGGSYGGFMTLMALLTEPEHFGGGAALRSVTDWAHYNHTYTANILNTPAVDSLAYVRSSPIYFAEGLEDPLLMLHGMVDTNVHFQDVVRLSQRFIELGKDNWELAVFPIESHGFVEPSSWTDEYKRILKAIQQTVGPEAR